MKANYNQMRAALDAPRPDVRLYLLHGPDEAGARDLAARLARSLGPEAERIDLEPAQLKASPGRLADEAASLSLFGGTRHLRVVGAGEESVEACTLLLSSARAGSPTVMIAPGAKMASKLVKLALAARSALALACYVPEGDEAEKLAIGIARELGLRSVGNTAVRIAVAAAGDRAIMTRELEKLALYLDASPERPRTLDDAALDAVGADLGETEISRGIDAAVSGFPDRTADELTRLALAGTSPIPLLRQLVRRLMTLAELRNEIDRGVGIAKATERVFFRERTFITRALRIWTGAQLNEAIDRVRHAERMTMRTQTPGAVVAEAAIMAVARMAARQH